MKPFIYRGRHSKRWVVRYGDPIPSERYLWFATWEAAVSFAMSVQAQSWRPLSAG